MKTMKLSTKIIGGFGVILLLMLIVIITYQVSSSKTTAGFSSLLAGDVSTNKHAAAIESAMLNARGNEKEFMIGKEMNYLSEHAKNIEELIANAAAIQQIKAGEGDHETAAEAERVITLAREYRKNFETFVNAQEQAGLDSESGAQGVFHSAALAIAESLPNFDVDNILIALLNMQRFEKTFVSSERPADKEKFIKAMDAYEVVLKSGTCEPEAQKSQETFLSKYRRWVREFIETDDTVYRMGIGDSLQDLAEKMESSINSVRVPGAMAMLLDVRKFEKDFIISKDPQYVEKTHQAVAKLHDAFANSGILQKHIDNTEIGITAYQKAFDEMVAEYAVMAEATESMSQTVRQIEPVVAKIIVESSEATEISTADISAMSQTLSRVAAIAGLTTFIVGIILSFLISRSITGPINKVVQWMTSGAEQVSAASRQVLSSSQVLADGASEQAAAIEETSASMEEMSAMTRQNADGAAQADSLMRTALKTIQGTDQSMDEMSTSMEKIASACEDTFKIIKTIDEIAFQTNLLALNAAVEAARAGEAGAGFAVVADEVRNLAMRATEAAKNTADLIEETIQQVNSGKDIVVKTTAGFKEVNKSSAKVGVLVGEIATASKEQAQGLTQINRAITQMDNVTQQNSASAEESAAASQELSAQAEAMMGVVRDLKSMVEGKAKSGGGAVSRKLLPQKASRLKAAPAPESRIASF